MTKLTGYQKFVDFLSREIAEDFQADAFYVLGDIDTGEITIFDIELMPRSLIQALQERMVHLSLPRHVPIINFFGGVNVLSSRLNHEENLSLCSINSIDIYGSFSVFKDYYQPISADELVSLCKSIMPGNKLIEVNLFLASSYVKYVHSNDETTI